ncbi:MAG TPA: hypothetical protein VF691_11135 [Cytophagaceae bacterium]|jgi:hypothetical protein
MIKLYFSSKDALIQTWESKLERLPIDSQLIEAREVNHPFLEYGKDTARGAKEITRYLEELEKFVNGWYECRCDNYPSL